MSAHYPFSLPPLPYPYDALAPQLDRVTLQLHHDRLFGSYTDSLNSLLASWPPYHDWPLPQLILRTHPTLRCSPDRRARARTSFRLSLSDRKTVPSYALRCPPSTPGVKKRPPEPSPRPSGPRPT